jgi:hypothetical protein
MNHLAAEYYSLYATNQVDVADRLRFGLASAGLLRYISDAADQRARRAFNNEGVPLTAGPYARAQ